MGFFSNSSERAFEKRLEARKKMKKEADRLFTDGAYETELEKWVDNPDNIEELTNIVYDSYLRVFSSPDAPVFKLKPEDIAFSDTHNKARWEWNKWITKIVLAINGLYSSAPYFSSGYGAVSLYEVLRGNKWKRSSFNECRCANLEYVFRNANSFLIMYWINKELGIHGAPEFVFESMPYYYEKDIKHRTYTIIECQSLNVTARGEYRLYFDANNFNPFLNTFVSGELQGTLEQSRLLSSNPAENDERLKKIDFSTLNISRTPKLVIPEPEEPKSMNPEDFQHEVEKLKKLKEEYDSQAISKEEYDRLRNEILNQM